MELEKVEQTPRRVVVVATNQQEMASAQRQLIAWADQKVVDISVEMAELDQNLNLAKKNKLNTSRIQRNIAKLEKKRQFYEKAKAAFEEGYVLVPNQEMDVFLVRTSRNLPPCAKQDNSTTFTESPRIPFVPDIQSNRPALGDGKNVSNRPETTYSQVYKEGFSKDGKQIYNRYAWATDFNDVIDFPFDLAKPQVVELTTRAAALKIFDELGVLPQTRKGDPMVLGKIFIKEGWRRKEMTFLVAWFVDTRGLP